MSAAEFAWIMVWGFTLGAAWVVAERALGRLLDRLDRFNRQYCGPICLAIAMVGWMVWKI